MDLDLKQVLESPFDYPYATLSKLKEEYAKVSLNSTMDSRERVNDALVAFIEEDALIRELFGLCPVNYQPAMRVLNYITSNKRPSD